MNSTEYIFTILCGMIPLIWLYKPIYLWAITFPIFIWYFLTSLMKKKIQGYTGDCCGATVLLCELGFYLGIVIIYNTLSNGYLFSKTSFR